MNLTNIGTGHQHHNIFSEFLEHLLEKMGANEKLTHFIVEFLTDSISIFLLLFIIMFSVSFLQTYIDFEKLRKKLSGLKSVWGYALALALGVLSPFCSCTIVPVLIGMLRIGIPISVSICYLTSSSLLNLTALLALYSYTNSRFVLIYIIISIIITLVTSIALSFYKRNPVLDYTPEHCCEHHHVHGQASLKSRAAEALHSTGHIFKSAYLFILLGTLLSSLILTFFNLDTIAGLINNNSVTSVILSALIGAPIHSDIFTIAPILVLLGDISLSVSMSFTVATMAISIPEVVLLTQAFKAKFIFLYAGILIALSMISGILLQLFI